MISSPRSTARAATVLQTGNASVRRSLSRRAAGLVLIAVLLALAVMLSLAVGNKYIPPGEVWTALVAPGEGYAQAVVDSRIPRTVLGLLVGASLAVAGAVMQGLTRNPLGDPGLFGVNAGAAAAVVTATAFLGIGAGSTSVWVALPGAFVAVAVVYLIGAGGSRSSPIRLVLAGVVVSAVLAAWVSAVTLSLPGAFDSYRYWLVGSLAGRNPATILEVLPFVLVGLVIALSLAGPLNALALGDDLAQALGVHVGRTRLLGAIATTLLCAAATAAVGPIGFVGLAVPHVVRSVTGSDHRWLLPYCLVAGPVLLLGADVLGRVIVSPAELMVGIITAFVGAPILLLAVRRMRVSE